MTKTIEYRVREVKRYVVTRYESCRRGSGSISTKGEYENAATAHEVGYALCKAEHDIAGTAPDDGNFIYPRQAEPLNPSGAPSSSGAPPLTAGGMAR